MYKDVVKIYTDGGSRGNPGLSAAAFIVIVNNRIIFKSAKYLGYATNNQSEYQGLIMALNWLINNKSIIGNKEIFIYLDSELVVKQMKGLYKTKNIKIKNLYINVNKLIKLINNKIYFNYINREKNKLADRLVNLQIDENTRNFT